MSFSHGLFGREADFVNSYTCKSPGHGSVLRMADLRCLCCKEEMGELPKPVVDTRSNQARPARKGDDDEGKNPS